MTKAEKISKTSAFKVLMKEYDFHTLFFWSSSISNVLPRHNILKTGSTSALRWQGVGNAPCWWTSQKRLLPVSNWYL